MASRLLSKSCRIVWGQVSPRFASTGVGCSAVLTQEVVHTAIIPSATNPTTATHCTDAATCTHHHAHSPPRAYHTQQRDAYTLGYTTSWVCVYEFGGADVWNA
jgi:hypothetical protein